MFKEPGKKLKNLAKIIFWLVIVLHILFALGVYGAVVQELGSTSGTGFALIIIIVVGLLIGVLVGWLSSIILYAFGELIEDTHATRKAVERIEHTFRE